MSATRRNRETGTMITIGDAEQDGWDPDGGRWYTLCEDHAQIINHSTLALARAHAAGPTMWCEVCSGNYENDAIA